MHKAQRSGFCRPRPRQLPEPAGNGADRRDDAGDRGGYTEIHLPYKPEVTQQHGYIHGGVVGMIADSAAGYSAATLTSADTGCSPSNTS